MDTLNSITPNETISEISISPKTNKIATGNDIVEFDLNTGINIKMDQTNLQGSGNVNLSANLSWPSVLKVLSLFNYLKKALLLMKQKILFYINNSK